jgi:hypothetical protein
MMNGNATTTHLFWNWLSDHRLELDNLESPNQPFWDAILEHLHKVNDGLWIELSSGPAMPREFIITAQGDARLFPLADALVAAAPDLPGWKVISLKQPHPDDPLKQTTYEGHVLQPSKMWFLPLFSKSGPALMALRVAVPAYREEDRVPITNAILVMLDSILGERNAALEVQEVFPCEVPPDPAASGFIEFHEIARFIAWRKSKRKT